MADTPVDPHPDQQLRTALADVLPGVRADLDRLVRIPSVSADRGAREQVARSAQLVADLLTQAGLPEVRVVDAGGAPAVIARSPAPPGAPTVLLYAHHDVQPPGSPAAWTSPPYEPTERDGRLYGRGSTDDKAGVLAHIAALRAWQAAGLGLPVGVTVFVEGEEEVGSPTLGRLLATYGEALRADVLVLADSSNWAVGVPALTTSLRGLFDCVVEVATLDHALHSGMYGGAVPDALTALIRLLASLYAPDGSLAVAGLTVPATPFDPIPGSMGPRLGAPTAPTAPAQTAPAEGPAGPLGGLIGPRPVMPAEQLRGEAGLLDGVSLLGHGPLTQRLWQASSLTVVGIDAPRIEEASNTLQPRARAKLSLRVPPGLDAADAAQALRAHLQEHAPWGAHVQVIDGELGQPFRIRADDPAVAPAYLAAGRAFQAAWGRAPVDIGVGGSIPFIAEFARAFPHAAILVTGVEDPDGRAHGIDESVHLGEFARVCLAETLLLAELARSYSSTRSAPPVDAG